MDDLSSDIMEALRELQLDVNVRNTYINERDRVIYEDGLFDTLEFPDGSDKTLFNYLQRAVQIHKSQHMGRGFQIYSSYNKEDIDIIPPAPAPDPNNEQAQQTKPEDAKKLAELKNKSLQALADTRAKAVRAIIDDNGGMAKFEQGAEIGSAYGGTIYKLWLDKKAKRVNISLLETPQNYFAGWSNSDFRDRDYDAYLYQISETQASKLYGDKLKAGEYFETAQEGNPFSINNNITSDPISTLNDSPMARTTTSRKMVNVVEFTGTLCEWSNDGKKMIDDCKPGEEKPFNALIVGGKVVQVIMDPDLLPRYFLIPNQVVPRRAWGASDISDAAIEINRSYIEVMSTWMTLFHRETAPVYKAKGFVTQNVPRRNRKKATFIPMTLEQDISELGQQNSFGPNSRQVLEELKDALVRVLGIGRVLFDDPTINPTSNQALMTTLKGVIDIVESKQKIWEPVLVDMFTEALNLSARIVPELKEAVADPGWKLYTRWPSVLRREDATYQQMWLNRFNAGTVSVATYLEAMGTEDLSEEIDRLRDDMADPVRAAILSHQLGLLAQQVIAPPSAPAPDVKVNLRGDLTPYQEANIASSQGFNSGPFPPTAGPQGQQGLAAGENADNVGFLTGSAFNGGTPIQQGPDGQPIQDQPNPVLTPDQNTGQTASQPGSGAPAVSPQGAINMANQQAGK